MRIRRMPMHLSSGHVTLVQRKFYPLPPNFPQSDLGRREDSRWALPQISSTIWKELCSYLNIIICLSLMLMHHPLKYFFSICQLVLVAVY